MKVPFNLSKKNLVIVIWAVVCIVVIIIAIVSSLIIDNSSEESPGESRTGEPVVLSNFEQCAKNFEGSDRELIESVLRTIININGKENEKPNDAMIRDCLLSKNPDGSLAFIVDIPSIGQSYKVSDQNTGSGDTITILCLEKDKLKYDEFSCQDRLAAEMDMPRSDAILQYVPYNSGVFTVEVRPGRFDYGIDKMLIDVRASGITKSQAETEVDKWLRSLGLDPEDYIKLTKVD